MEQERTKTDWNTKLTDAINALFEIQNMAYATNASQDFKVQVAEAIVDLLRIRRGL